MIDLHLWMPLEAFTNAAQKTSCMYWSSMKPGIGFVKSKLGKDQTMDMEEVYLRQINEHLKRQTELQEANNELLRELLQRLGN